MGSLRNQRCRLIAGLIALAQTMPAAAQTLSADPLYLFATCTGRFSALIEHQWLVSDPASDQTARLRSAMIDLVEAASPAGPAPQVMQWRLEAKVATAGLLQRAHFGPTPQQKALANRQIAALIGTCRSYLGNDGSA